MTNLTVEKPFLVKDFLDFELYKEIYEVINPIIDKNFKEKNDKYADPFVRAGSNGFVILFEPFEDNFYNWIQEKISKKIGKPVNRPNILFCRYTKDSGFSPRLLPHTDRAMKYPAVTLTVELEKTLDWDIYVEEEKFELEKNSALFFSGSHQMHYRPYPTFGNDDYYDILLIHTTLDSPNQEELTEEHFDAMDRLSGDYIQRKFELFEGGLDERPRN